MTMKYILPACLALLVGCEDKSQSIVQAPNINNSTKVYVAPSPQYSSRGVDNSWPTLGTDQIVVDASQLSNKNYYVIFDGSGSMKNVECTDGRSKIAVAKEAVSRFVEQIPTSANIGIAGFDARGIKEYVSLFRSTKANSLVAINDFRAKGGTPLRSAIWMGYQSLQEQAKRQLGYGEYHLIVVTDGQASSGEDPSSMVEKIAGESPVVIHTIGFCIDGRHSLNQKGIVLYKSASDPQSLSAGLDSVLAESENFDIASFNE